MLNSISNTFLIFSTHKRNLESQQWDRNQTPDLNIMFEIDFTDTAQYNTGFLCLRQSRELCENWSASRDWMSEMRPDPHWETGRVVLIRVN